MATQPPPIPFEAWRPIRDDQDVREFAVSFPSAVVSGVESNDVVPLQVFLPASGTGPFPAVLILHYWGARDLRFERSFAGELARRGVASAILTLPYHLTRAPTGTRSGERAIDPDPERLSLTIVQSVQDARRALDFLASRPEIRGDRLGIAGTSLGAIVSSLTYAVEPRLTHATFMLGGVDLAKILWRSSRTVEPREAMRRRGLTEARLREVLAPVEPLNYLSRRTTGREFVVGARYDTVVPAATTERLIAALPSPKVLWLDTGHYGGVFVQRRLQREVARFFGEEMAGGTFVPPKRLVAPTIRLGVQMNTQGADIAVGLDVWRFDRRGDGFASLLATPRGPGLFVGWRLERGLSIGATASPKRSSFGLFWSTVL